MPEDQTQSPLARAELIHSALSRSLLIAESLALMSDCELIATIRERVDTYRAGVGELVKVLDETLSPAMEAASELLADARKAPSPMTAVVQQ